VGVRIKGQEVVVRLVDSATSAVQRELTDVKSFDLEVMMTALQEGYLGKTSDDFDDIYKGVTGKLELHLHDDTIINLINDVLDRSTRRVPGTKFSIQARFNFPNGVSRLGVVRDVVFDNIPLGVPGRDAFATTTLNVKSGNLAFV